MGRPWGLPGAPWGSVLHKNVSYEQQAPRRSDRHQTRCVSMNFDFGGPLWGAPPAPPGRKSKIGLRASMGTTLQNNHVKFRCNPSRIKKALGFFRLRRNNNNNNKPVGANRSTFPFSLSLLISFSLSVIFNDNVHHPKYLTSQTASSSNTNSIFTLLSVSTFTFDFSFTIRHL